MPPRFHQLSANAQWSSYRACRTTMLGWGTCSPTRAGRTPPPEHGRPEPAEPASRRTREPENPREGRQWHFSCLNQRPPARCPSAARAHNGAAPHVACGQLRCVQPMARVVDPYLARKPLERDAASDHHRVQPRRRHSVALQSRAGLQRGTFSGARDCPSLGSDRQGRRPMCPSQVGAQPAASVAKIEELVEDYTKLENIGRLTVMV